MLVDEMENDGEDPHRQNNREDRLWRENIPFAAGILQENDVEYKAAVALASEVVAEKAFYPVGQDKVHGATAHPEWHQRPQRAAEGFQLNGILVVGHARLAQMQPGAACGITGLERVEKFVHQCGKIRFGLQVHHQYISQSLVRRVSASM